MISAMPRVFLVGLALLIVSMPAQASDPPPAEGAKTGEDAAPPVEGAKTGAVSTTKMGAGAMSTTKMGAGAMSSTKMGAGATTTAKKGSATMASSTTKQAMVKETVFTSSVTMTVPDPEKFKKDTDAQKAVRTGIAKEAGDIKLEYVSKLTVTIPTAGGRRLAAAAVKIDYAITIPSTSTVKVDVVQKKLKAQTKTTLTTAIQAAVLTVKGKDYKIEVTKVEKVIVKEVMMTTTKKAGGGGVAATADATGSMLQAVPLFLIALHQLLN